MIYKTDEGKEIKDSVWYYVGGESARRRYEKVKVGLSILGEKVVSLKKNVGVLDGPIWEVIECKTLKEEK